MTHLDRMFEHYLDAIMRGETVTNSTPVCTLTVGWDDDTLSATAATVADARADLRVALAARVFASMRTGTPMPVITGIDLNGGSC